MNAIKVINNTLLGLLSVALIGCTPHKNTSPVQTSESRSGALKVVTWNVEHLAFPITDGCKPRTLRELVKLQRYAEQLNADIVALQEVASIEAMALLFPAEQWQLFISQRPDSKPYECRDNGFTSTQQKVGYAVRKGVMVAEVKTLASFGLDNPGLRHGLEMLVQTPLGEITMLNVHMKSGCFVDNFSRSDRTACTTFAQQAPVLDAWIERREAIGTPYIVLGDFNHRISAPYNHLTRMMRANTDGSSSSLTIATKELIGCHPWYPAPIDHVVLGHFDKRLQLAAKAYDFEDMTVENMLSDHCAVTLSINTP